MTIISIHANTSRAETASITLKIDGQINVSSVGSLLLQLAGALEHADEVCIDLSGVTKIDFAGLQLFCACHRSSLLTTKSYRITGQNNPAIWDAASVIGKLRKQHCAIDSKHTCIWVGE
jgi:ABC-type transporter Mla MlaB component